MEETDVFPYVAAAVGDAAVRLGIARRPLSREEFFTRARARMDRAERVVRALARSRVVPKMPTQRSLLERPEP
jgi:hypothetical protein